MTPPARRVDRVAEIVQLHAEISEAWRTTLPLAIRIGELLAAQKAEIPHGQWLPWVKANLPFSERTAQDYLRFYKRRAELKSATVADLPAARRALAVARPARVGAVKAALARPVARGAIITPNPRTTLAQVAREPLRSRLAAALWIVLGGH